MSHARGTVIRSVLRALAFAVLLLPHPAKAQPVPEATPRTYVFAGDAIQPPYQYLDDAGQPQGFNVDLIRAISRISGRPIEVRLGTGNRLDTLIAGEADLTALSYTERRAQTFDFLAEVWTARLSVFFQPGRASPPDDVSKLGNEVVAVRFPSLSRDTLAALPEGQRPILVPSGDHASLVSLLREGRVTAVAGNDIGLRSEFARLGLVEVPELLVKASSYRLATSKGRGPEFAWIGESLARLRESGEFSRIVEKHLADQRPADALREFAHNAGIVIAVLAVVFVLVLVWNWSLRTQVAARTARLAEAAAEKDGLVRSLAEREQRMRVLLDQMRDSEERYRAFVERSTEGIMRWELKSPVPLDATLDQQMRHLATQAYVGECNDAMARLYGLSAASDLLDLTFDEVRKLRTPPADMENARRFVASGFQATKWEANWTDPDGVSRWSANVVMGIVEGGRVVRAWAVQQDITQQKVAEHGLRHANHQLELKNAELERFTYTVSHDLRSPLITIRGYLGHLETSAAEGNLERFREDAARIDRAAAKMDALLRDLLELSRIGRILHPEADVPMRAVAQDAADLLRGPLRHRGVRIEIDPALPVVRGDRQRLLEVVQNLVENATKFMGDQKEPVIRVGVRRDDNEPVFLVTDNGIGIDPRHREKVFDLFEKLTPQGEGTGVGLALVKRIVEAHGGRVWVESPGGGHGSTFCFTLRPTPQAV